MIVPGRPGIAEEKISGAFIEECRLRLGQKRQAAKIHLQFGGMRRDDNADFRFLGMKMVHRFREAHTYPVGSPPFPIGMVLAWKEPDIPMSGTFFQMIFVAPVLHSGPVFDRTPDDA